MQKLMCAAVCFLSVGLVAYGETLTYQGGGIWNSSSLTWKDASGATVAWKDGAIAAFPESADVAVQEDGIRAGGLVLGSEDSESTFTFSGGKLTFAEDSTIKAYAAAATFSNDLWGEGHLKMMNPVDPLISAVVTEGESQSLLPIGEANAALLFKDTDLSHLTADSLQCTYQKSLTKWQGTIYTGCGNGGFYFPKRENGRLSIQLQGPGYAGHEVCVRLGFKQVGSDVYGWAEDVYWLPSPSAGEPQYGRDIDVVGPYSWYGIKLYYKDESEVDASQKVAIRNLGYSFTKLSTLNFLGNLNGTDGFLFEVGDTVEVMLSGSLGVQGQFPGSGLKLDNRPSKRGSEPGVFIYAGTETLSLTSRLTIGDNVSNDRDRGILRVAQGSTVIFEDDGIQLGDTPNAAVEVYGTTYDRSRGYVFPAGRRVMAGGVHISEIVDSYAQHGLHHAGTFYVYSGGTIQANKTLSLSTWPMPYVIDGGTMEITYACQSEYERVDIAQLELRNGAKVIGHRLSPSFYAPIYSQYIKASGASPSRIDCEALWFFQGRNMSSDACFIVLDIEDVTGDASSDLFVSCPIVDKASNRPDSFQRYGLNKKGEGTIEFQNSAQMDCALKMEAGTVCFRTKGGTFGGLLVVGDSALDVTDGAQVAFGDSSAIAWTDGKTLTLKSRLDRKSLRFGTDANGLTADQLAAIRYADDVTTKTPIFLLDVNGYLTDGLGGGFFIRVR